ncbi:MAG TPA: deoxyribose-phosphate aldolase [Casimicrobiaceae bacterium]|nr:deoxyribose-phosphate aldolase [Casimicrobiaceae bacterium]
MTRNELARLLDHSVLKPESTEADIRAGIDVVLVWRIGYFCVQPCWVKLAAGALAGADAGVVSVVGFPHGADRAATKAHAAALAQADGAREIDTVLNIGALKSGAHGEAAADLAAVVRAVPDIPVKVIIEAGALTDDEKRLACRLAIDAGAAFVKTSTGFHPAGGATVADVRLMRAVVGPQVGVKASGGIRALADALAMLAAGANRLGTSASASILAALD